MKSRFIAVSCIFILTLFAVVRASECDVVSGRAMGTSYTLRLASHSDTTSVAELEDLVKNELERIEAIFSLYRPDSELSRWNAAPDGVWIEVSADLFAVSQFAIELSRQTGGAFDPTIRPLMTLWNLDSLSGDWKPPTFNLILDTKKQMGVGHLDLQTNPPAMRKRSKAIQLDLNASVEGWAIDRIVSMLTTHGLHDFLFELGGEFGAIGKSNRGLSWTVGIEDPSDPSRLISRVALNGEALCTSGSTKHRRRYRDKHYSHILDPRTGYPIEHDLAAVSVLHTNAMSADGWATALMVLGPVQGQTVAQQNGLIASFACVTLNGSQVQLSRIESDRFERTSFGGNISKWFSRYQIKIICAALVIAAVICMGVVLALRRRRLSAKLT